VDHSGKSALLETMKPAKGLLDAITSSSVCRTLEQPDEATRIKAYWAVEFALTAAFA